MVCVPELEVLSQQDRAKDARRAKLRVTSVVFSFILLLYFIWFCFLFTN